MSKINDVKVEKRWQPCAEFRFWLYDPEGDGMVYFRSAEERDAAAEDAIQDYVGDGWSEEVERVAAGEVTHVATQTDRVDRQGALDEDGNDEAGEYWGSDEFEHKCSYKLLPIAARAQEPRS